jgi:DNA-binding SARP family transcriptional activator
VTCYNLPSFYDTVDAFMSSDQDRRYEISLLGRFEVRLAGRVLLDRGWSRRKAQAVLKLLALSPRRALHRDEILEHVWPELDPASGANNLHKNVHYIRTTLAAKGADEPVLNVNRDLVELAENVRVDVHEFRALAQSALSSGELASFDGALALYRGDLLPDNLYDEWTISEREDLKRLHLELLLASSRLYEARGRYQEAISSLQALLRSEPTEEEAHRRLMRLYSQSGSRHRALRQYQVCKEVLMQELGVAPSPETEAAYREIVEAKEAAPAAPAETTPAAAAPVYGAASTPPLFGRDRELEAIEEALDSALASRGRAVFIRGEAGIGKSHLLAAALDSARESGFLVLGAHCYHIESSVAYQPVREALREAFDGVSAGPARAFAEHSTYLTRLLVGGGPAQPATGDLGMFQLELFAELDRFLELLSRERPVAIWFDDVHEADAETLRMLHFLARNVATRRLLLLGTYRVEEVSGGYGLRDMLSSLSRETKPTEIQLYPLDDQALSLLADELFQKEPVEPQLRREVLDKAEGNPLFAAELVHTYIQEGWARLSEGRWQRRDPGIGPLPSAVRDLVDRRLRRLSGDAQEQLQAAAVIGRELDYALLCRMLERPERQVLDALDECIDASIIEETGEGYRFRHELLRETIYGGISRARRQVLHRTVAEVLEQSPGRQAAEVEALAHHYSLSDRPIRAFPFLVESASKSAALFANEKAAGLYRRAIEVGRASPEVAPAALADALEALGDLNRRMGEVEASVGLFQEAGALLAAAGESEAAIRVEGKTALGLIILGRPVEAQTAIEEMLEGLTEQSPQHVVSRTYYLLAQLHWHSGQNREALAAAETALVAASAGGDEARRAQAYEVMALACHSLGDWQRGVELELERQSLGVPGFDTDEAFEAHL